MTAQPFSFLPQEVKGKRVLITGGTKGIGAATVQRFQQSGALVATTARNAPSNNDASLLFVKADTDLGTQPGVAQVVDRIEREWGGIDILVNNLRPYLHRPAQDQSKSGICRSERRHQRGRGENLAGQLHALRSRVLRITRPVASSAPALPMSPV